MPRMLDQPEFLYHGGSPRGSRTYIHTYDNAKVKLGNVKRTKPVKNGLGPGKSNTPELNT